MDQGHKGAVEREGNGYNTNKKYSPINPNNPKTLPNTSTTRTLTNRSGSAASARAAVLPATPTQIPQKRLQTPTVRPPKKRAKPGEKNEMWRC
jgi:hypothetical protein